MTKKTVNVTIDPKLLEAVDRVCKRVHAPLKPNRSAALDCALRLWCREHGEDVELGEHEEECDED